MKQRKYIQWIGSVLGIVLLAALGSLAWVDYQLRRFSGAFTELVDRSQFEWASGTTAITNVSVLAADGDRMVAGRTVVLEGGRIAAIVDAAAPPPSGARIIDGTGRFLIPGLVDTHVHLRHSRNDLLLYLANGVTQIWEMSGNRHHLAWRRDTRAGLPGPDMFIASEKLGSWDWLDGQFQRWTRNRINLAATDAAAALVESLAARGFDAIKIGSWLDAAGWLAVCRAAIARGVPVVGHVPISSDLGGLRACGQQQVAHIEEIVKALDREFGGFNPRNASEFHDFVERRGAEVARSLREGGVAVSTTMWLIESIPAQKADIGAALRDVQLRYVNPGLVEGTPLSPGWLPGNHPYAVAEGTDAQRRAVIEQYWSDFAEAHRIVLRALAAEGVRMMAGTDANNAIVVPGFSLHDELQALHGAGLSAADSLRSATSVPGEWIEAMAGPRSRPPAGKLLPGYAADLVLLARDPLQRIDNTTRIEAVIVEGHAVDRAGLDRMLEAVERANDRSRSVDISASPGHLGE